MTDTMRLLDGSQNSLALEQYRALRTNLEFLWVGRQLKTVVITSSSPGAGKSLTVANLGIAFAMAGIQTLLIDGDLRRPALHRLFQVDERPGLTTTIMRGLNPHDSTCTSFIPRLAILPAGPIPPNPTELLANGRFEEVLSPLKDRFDMILIDTPPVLAYAETALLAHAADGTLYIVRAGKGSRRMDVKALERLSQAQAHVLGAVLNDAQPQPSDMAYYG
ncbi:CpsD/CapB family tyrosine-protein kinase [Sulfobacillus harzensis]|uniref:non-specific protein-tyrosine kinase n=1 Tax=Sulfobacillus harzensis TaxID=2729629 RepID=A0A7Y0L449_9FIRM|nr:CpsD/CapB family tyrosine-protein kinase [Sulfobacillus harzensis]NMP22956.1 CpsD/CapB family tyrosine-protein kinase [Sulfobacillus harzensis]